MSSSSESVSADGGGLGTQASVGLRAGGGAAILVFGALGVCLPFALHQLRDGAPWLLYTKAAAAGVVLALALVHLINDAFSTFAELTPGAGAQRARGPPRYYASGSLQPRRARRRALVACNGAAHTHTRRGGLCTVRSGFKRWAGGVDIALRSAAVSTYGVRRRSVPSRGRAS